MLHVSTYITGLAGSELELSNLVERFDKTSTAYGIQISAEKTKLMTNNTDGISSNIRVNGEKLKTVQSFKLQLPWVFGIDNRAVEQAALTSRRLLG